MEDHVLVRFIKKVNKLPGENACWEWTGCLSRNRYGQLRVGNKARHAHRLSYEHYKGRIGSYDVVRHLCNNPKCVNPNHLALGSPSDNAYDAKANGSTFGAKLNPQQVHEIRELLYYRVTQVEIAKKYGVTQSTIKKNKQKRRLERCSN